MSRLTEEEMEARMAGKTAPRITRESIEARIAKEEYYELPGLLTICTITMVNGFMVLGHSKAAHPDNHDPVVGRSNAYDRAFRQLWDFEAYLLREQLSQA